MNSDLLFYLKKKNFVLTRSKKKLTYATPAHQIRAYAAALVMFGRAAVIDDGFSCRRETVLSSFVCAGAIGHYSVSGGFDGAARWWRIWCMEVKETGRERETA
jgi:hypothetical protein